MANESLVDFIAITDWGLVGVANWVMGVKSRLVCTVGVVSGFESQEGYRVEVYPDVH